MMECLARCLRRPIVELAAAFSAAIDPQPSKSHNVVANAFSGDSVNLPKRTQGRRDRQRMSPWMEHRTVTSRCQPEERPVRLAPPGAGDHDKPRLRPRSMYPRNHAGNASPMIAGLTIAGARWLLT
jgi:hypothetical protein